MAEELTNQVGSTILKVGQTEQEMNSLQKAIADLKLHVDSVSDRLSAVLISRDKIETSNVVKQIESLAGLPSLIRENRFQIVQCVEKLEDILSRLEL